MADVQPVDLASVGRLDALFEEAVKRGLTGRASADRLRFLAAAARARRVATWNPGGFFSAFVRRRQWRFLSQIDEDQALAQLKAQTGTQSSPGEKSRSIGGQGGDPMAMPDRSGHGNELDSLVASVLNRWSSQESGVFGLRR